MEKNLGLIEETIEKIDSIIGCKFTIDENQEIQEVHIVSNGSRNAKQISRDVQSALIALYHLNIDYKKISIAEIPDLGLKRIKTRLKIESILHENCGSKTSIRVGLSDFKRSYETKLNGINTSRNIEKMMVEATLKNVESFFGYEDEFILEDIRTVHFSSDKVVMVIVMKLENGQEKRLSGSCIVGNDYKEAVVKATLDAVNRYIEK